MLKSNTVSSRGLHGPIAIVATFLLGRLADSSKIFHWRRQSIILASMMLFLMTALLFVREKWFIGPTFGFMYLLLCAINTMVNAASFYYEAKEVDVNFGLARGIGSATYAVFSTFVGRLTLAYGRIVVPAAGVLITFLLTLVILSMPYSGSVVEDSKDSSAKKADMNWIRLISKYPVLSLMVLANFFLIVFHNMYCSYMIRIVEKVGGDSNSLGLSLAIGAIFELPMMLAAVWMVKKIPDKLHIVMLLGSLGFLLRGGLFILATHMSHIYLAQMTSMFGYAVYASVGDLDVWICRICFRRNIFCQQIGRARRYGYRTGRICHVHICGKRNQFFRRRTTDRRLRNQSYASYRFLHSFFGNRIGCHSSNNIQ